MVHLAKLEFRKIHHDSNQREDQILPNTKGGGRGKGENVVLGMHRVAVEVGKMGEAESNTQRGKRTRWATKGVLDVGKGTYTRYCPERPVAVLKVPTQVVNLWPFPNRFSPTVFSHVHHHVLTHLPRAICVRPPVSDSISKSLRPRQRDPPRTLSDPKATVNGAIKYSAGPEDIRGASYLTDGDKKNCLPTTKSGDRLEIQVTTQCPRCYVGFAVDQSLVLALSEAARTSY